MARHALCSVMTSACARHVWFAWNQLIGLYHLLYGKNSLHRYSLASKQSHCLFKHFTIQQLENSGYTAGIKIIYAQAATIVGAPGLGLGASKTLDFQGPDFTKVTCGSSVPFCF